jgi:hypothetical protein
MGPADQLVAWRPQPKQVRALSCPVFELFYGGAKGGGKSDFLIMDFVDGTEYGSKHSGVLFRRTYPELDELWKRMTELYTPIGAVPSKQEHIWTFPKGATLKLRYLDSDDDVSHYQGHQYTWVGWDELTHWPTDYAYTWMFGCIRSPDGLPCRVRAAGNPGGRGHLWVKARFIDPVPPERIYYDPEIESKRVFIPARLEDNLRLIRNDPDYEKRLKATAGHLYHAYRFGDWNIFAGQVFSEWNSAVHVVQPFPIEPSWYRFASMDWGYDKPFSIGWWAIDDQGRMIRYREWYGCEKGRHNVGIKMPAKEVAKEAWRMSVAEGCREMVADPSIWSNSGHEEGSHADTFTAQGWQMHRGNNARVMGWQRLHELLKLKALDGGPMLVVFDTCKAFIRTVPVLSSDDRHPEDIDTTQEDHVGDETRYAVMSPLAQITTRTVLPSRPGKHTRTDWDPLSEGG